MDLKSSTFHESLVDNFMSQASFCPEDFVQSRSKSLTTSDAVQEILLIHASNLTGTNERRKYTKKKEMRLEEQLTRSGLRKLQDARNEMRMTIEKNKRRIENSEEIPKEMWASSQHFKEIGALCENDSPDEFFRKMQDWGNNDVSDCRYYLHMVFRFYLSEYHSLAVSNGLVISSPSMQKIIDIVTPNGCATRFPPEFRRFLNDSGGRDVKTAILPVPVKGSATEVSYDKNFELEREVRFLRRKIHGIFVLWKSNIHETARTIYPEYLHVGSKHNSAVVGIMEKYYRVEAVKKNVARLQTLDAEKLEQCSKTRLGDIHDEYSKHIFKTHGEQLKERIGFFFRTSIRKLFFPLRDQGLLEDLLLASTYGMDNFLSLDGFCTPNNNRQLSLLEKDEDMCRKVLMILVEIVFLVSIFRERDLAKVDSAKMVQGCLHLLN